MHAGHRLQLFWAGKKTQNNWWFWGSSNLTDQWSRKILASAETIAEALEANVLILVVGSISISGDISFVRKQLYPLEPSRARRKQKQFSGLAGMLKNMNPQRIPGDNYWRIKDVIIHNERNPADLHQAVLRLIRCAPLLSIKPHELGGINKSFWVSSVFEPIMMI